MKRGPIDFRKILHDEIAAIRSSNYPVRDCMESIWEVIFEEYKSGPYGLNGVPAHDYKRADEYDYENPFLALMTCIEDGYYPPPEILFAVFTCFNLYMRGYGDLEECLLGPKKRKAGTYARRHAQEDRNHRWASRMGALEAQGYKATQAAELISEESGGKFEPETILRTVSKPDLMETRSFSKSFSLMRKHKK